MAEADAAGPIVLYDGVCGLCNRSVQFILRHDRKGQFRFAALQSEAGQRLLREHGLPTDSMDTFVMIEGGRAFRKSKAVLKVVRRLDAPWPVFWPLIVIPRPIADFFYDRVAKNRYRMFGRLDACMLPPPEVRSRFLG